MTTKAKKHHWFPFYHDAWVIGTRHLNFEQQGIYLNLLLLQFDQGEVDLKRVDALWPHLSASDLLHSVLDEFFTTSEERNKKEDYLRFWWNTRLKEIMAEQAEKTAKRDKQLEQARAARSSPSVAPIPVTSVEPTPETKPATSTDTGGELEIDKELEIKLELEQQLQVKGELIVPPLIGNMRPNRRKKLLRYVQATVAAGENLSADEGAFAWNMRAKDHTELNRVTKVTEQRSNQWKACCKDNDFCRYYMLALDKLPIARNPSNPKFTWQPDFDWLIKDPGNAVKLAEGKYDNKAPDKAAEMQLRVEGFING